ncbi:MAG: FtsQ-type POTRA domain-containing protein [Lapillicoccus sp.]
MTETARSGPAVARRATADRSRGRFERRAAAVRRRPGTVLAMVAGLVVLLGVVVWLVGFSSVLATRTVTVTGLADPGEQEAVAAAAAVPVGIPLARVDTAGAAERVATIPTIASVSVSRSWPSTVVVSVQRKVAVLAVKGPQGQLQVVDATGVPFEAVSALPPGVAQVNATSDAADPEGIRAAISVLQLLSPERREQVSGVTVTSADLVTLQLGQVSVVWGGLADGPKKLAVLEVLLSTNPAVVDVSAPDTPITR